MHGGKVKASYTRILTSADANILAFERAKNNKKVIFISNLSKTAKQFTLPVEGEFTNYMSGQKITFSKNQKHDFKPWQYYILTN